MFGGPFLKSNMLLSVPASESKEPADALAAEPVVFDEADDRGLVGDGVVDVVLLRPGRDDQQRQTRTVAAAALDVGVPVTPARAVLALLPHWPGPVRASVGGLRPVDDGAHLVVVPAVGVVVGDDDGGGLPVRGLSEGS